MEAGKVRGEPWNARRDSFGLYNCSLDNKCKARSSDRENKCNLLLLCNFLPWRIYRSTTSQFHSNRTSRWDFREISPRLSWARSRREKMYIPPPLCKPRWSRICRAGAPSEVVGSIPSVGSSFLTAWCSSVAWATAVFLPLFLRQKQPWRACTRRLYTIRRVFDFSHRPLFFGGWDPAFFGFKIRIVTSTE